MENSPGKIFQSLVDDLAEEGKVTPQRVHDATGMGLAEARELLEIYRPAKKPKGAAKSKAQPVQPAAVDVEVPSESSVTEVEETQRLKEDAAIPPTQPQPEWTDRQPDEPEMTDDELLRAKTLDFVVDENQADESNQQLAENAQAVHCV